MKTEKRIYEEIERLESEVKKTKDKLVKLENEAKIKALEWVLTTVEPLEDFYYVGSIHFGCKEDLSIFKGLDKAKEYFNYEKEYLFGKDEISIYQAVICSDTGAVFPDYETCIDSYIAE